MRLSSTLSACIAALWTGFAAADPTWPSAIDELEDVMFLSTGHRSRNFASAVTPCGFSAAGAGRQTAAEWLRAGFHDMSTTNVYFSPHGGIDASLALELNDGENIGLGFEDTFKFYGGFFNSRLSVADLVALGVYTSVRSCGGPIIPMRGGRVDALVAGPIGVPQPQNSVGTFENQFLRMGFNTTAMIQMTACGHTLGGVHASDFSNIVTPGTVTNDFQLFDNTYEFDNSIATRYINGPDTDALAVGISRNSGRASDLAVFSADQNVTLQAMTDPATFNSMCTAILQEMIETVDPALVNLSNIIEPYNVKPAGLQLTLLAGGEQIQFAGDIRVRTTQRSASQIASVQLAYNDRTGAPVSSPIMAAAGGTANGLDDSFSFYSFSKNMSAISSISSFTVLINLVSGSTETHDNNGQGYPISDSVIVQVPQSCYYLGNLTVVAAVRSTVTMPVNITVTQKTAANSGSPTPSPIPILTNATASMIPGASVGPYQLYTASYAISSEIGTKYGVVSGSHSDTFKDPGDLGNTCSSLGPATPSSSSSITSTISSTLSTSSTKRTTSSSSRSKSSSSSSKLSSSSSKSSTILTKSSTTSAKTAKSTKATTKSTTKSSITSTKSISTSSTPTSSLHIVRSAGLYNYYGCHTEGPSVRALSSAFYPSDSQTVEQCVAACSPYLYAGLEYGRECWCGSSFGAGSETAPDADCNMVCAGDQYEYCGAGNRLSVYIRNGTVEG